MSHRSKLATVFRIGDNGGINDIVPKFDIDWDVAQNHQFTFAEFYDLNSRGM
jgi:hypothetical protein